MKEEGREEGEGKKWREEEEEEGRVSVLQTKPSSSFFRGEKPLFLPSWRLDWS